MQAVPQSADCCDVCPSPVIQQIPGPTGPAGANGTNGTNGVNAFTTTTASFVMPAVAGTVTVAVLVSSWAVPGQAVYVSNAGYFTVNSVPDATHISLRNLGYAGNVAPTTVVATTQKVGPAGIKGTDGVSPPANTLNSLSPTTTKGDLIVDNGVNAPLASDVRLPVGTNGQILTGLSTQPTGLEYQTLLPNGATDNVLPRFDASGTTIPTPLQSSGLRVTDNGAIQETAGNAKGTDAVDLQPIRAAATQVASGANATLAGGLNNTASGARASVGGGTTNLASGADSHIGGGDTNEANHAWATVGGGSTNVAGGTGSVIAGGGSNVTAQPFTTVGGGTSNQATANAAVVAGGELNVASGDHSAIGGGTNHLASNQYTTVAGGGQNSANEVGMTVGGGVSNAGLGTTVNKYSTIPGGLYGLSTLHGQLVHASGRFTIAGDAQTSELIWRNTTANATVTELFLDGAAARAVLYAYDAWAFRIITVARNVATQLSAVWETVGGIKRSAGPLSLIGAVTHTKVCDDGEAWMVLGAVAVDADTANVALRIKVTGAVATNIRWVAHARLVQVTTP